MFVLCMLVVTVLSYRGHGTSACLLPTPFPHLSRDASQTRRSAKVWTRFQLVHDLVGHTQSVWAVIAMEGDEYLTGARSFCGSPDAISFDIYFPQDLPIRL